LNSDPRKAGSETGTKDQVSMLNITIR
jgi:hypothetical protein